MNNNRPRVVLDIGPAVHQGAGLARYAERLAAHLLADHTDAIDLTLFYNAYSGDTLPTSLNGCAQIALPIGQYGWRLSVLASQAMRWPYLPLLKKTNPALYHASEHLLPCLPCPTVLTVHDLIFEHYPQFHTWRNTWFLRTAMPLFVRAATAIIAVSQHTKRDLVDLYHTPPEKIHVIHEGVVARFRPASPASVERVRRRYSPDRPYLLMVGTLEPRKNHAVALAALLRLKQLGHPHRLLIAGGKGWLFEPIRQMVDEMGLHEDVNFTGYLPDEDLPAAYSGADCVLLPSLFEGFGFPVLEAMACGAPVVCSNVSSLPEVAGDAALLVSPHDDAGLAHALHLLISQPGLAAELRERGLLQASRFRWEQCARATCDLYLETIRSQSLSRRTSPQSYSEQVW